MSPGRFRAALAVALLTAFVALFLRYESARYEATGAASTCSKLGSECDAVQTSAYAKVMGVSLATWGALGAATLLAWLLASRREPALLVATGAAAALAVAVVLYTAFVSWIRLGKVCLYCSAMQAGFLALAVLVVPAAWRARALLPRRPLLLGGTVACLLLALALSGEAYAAERIALARVFRPSGKAMRLDISDTLVLGDPKTPVEVILFFDFGCPVCHDCYTKAVKLIEKHPRCVHFRFKHYPLDAECNDKLAKTEHPAACRAALAGQAAQSLGLDDAGMKAIFGHREDGFTPIVLKAIGDELKVPRETWAGLLASPGVKALVDRDIAEGNALQLPHVPFAYVNGRVVDSQRLPESIDRHCK